MADINRTGAIVHRAWGINAAHVTPLVDGFNLQRNRLLLANLDPQGHTVGVKALQRPIHLAKSGLGGKLWPQRVQRGTVLNAPADSAQGISCFKGRWQRWRIRGVQLNAGAAQGGKLTATLVAGEAKILHKTGAVAQVINAKLQLFNSGNTHKIASYLFTRPTSGAGIADACPRL